MNFGYFSSWQTLVERGKGLLALRWRATQIHLVEVRDEVLGEFFTLSRPDLQINKGNHGFKPGQFLNLL